MDYRDIIIESYGSENTRNYLSNFFLRKYNDIKTDFYSFEEFFDGCVLAIERCEKDLANDFDRQLSEFKKALKDAKNKKGIYDPKLQVWQEEERLLVLPQLKKRATKPREFVKITISSSDGNYILSLKTEDISKIKGAIYDARLSPTQEIQQVSANNPKIEEIKKPRFQYIGRTKILTIFYSITYLLDMLATKQSPPFGSKHAMEEIGRIYLPETSGNRFYQGCNKVQKLGGIEKINLEKIIGSNWRDVVFHISKHPPELEAFLKETNR